MVRDSLHCIRPYKYAGGWVFDDPTVGLKRQPFVSGADEVIDRFVCDTPGALLGFDLTFSADPFEGYQVALDWSRPEADGNWFTVRELSVEAWLSSALLRYYDEVPRQLYVKFG